MRMERQSLNTLLILRGKVLISLHLLLCIQLAALHYIHIYLLYRSQKRAEYYIKLLKGIKISIMNMNETSNYAQRALLMHDNWIETEFKGLQLFSFMLSDPLYHLRLSDFHA